MFKVFIFNPSESYSFANILKMIYKPQWSLWFLPALSVWMLSLKFIKKVKVWHIVVAFIITLVIGFVPFIDDAFTLSRIFYFFPFYLFGRWCGQNKEKFNEIIRKLHKNLYKIISLLVLIATILLLALVFDLPKYFFYGKHPYESAIGIVYRIICLSLGVINSLAIMILVPFKEDVENNSVFSLSRIGKNTLCIYLFHPLFLLFFNNYCSIYFMQHWSIGILICLAISIILFLVLSLKPFTTITNYLLNIFNRKKEKVYEKEK